MRDVSQETPGLSSSERAFALTEGPQAGKRCKVTTRRVHEDPDMLRIKVRAYEIDADGEAVERGGAPVMIPAFARNVSLDALEAGEVSMGQVLAEATCEAVSIFRDHVCAVEAWTHTPTAA